MPKTIKEFQLNQSTGEVSVEYSDDSTSKFNAADMVTAQTDAVTGGRTISDSALTAAIGLPPAASVVNPDVVRGAAFRKIFNGARAGVDMQCLILGDSIGFGFGSGAASTGDRMNGFIPQFKRYLSGKGIRSQCEGWIGNGLGAAYSRTYDGRLSATGGGVGINSLGGRSFLFGSAGDGTLVFTPSTPVNRARLYFYRFGGGGVINYSVDGGTSVGVNVNGTAGLIYTDVDLGSVSTHQISITYGSGNGGYLLGIDAWDTSIGGLRFVNACINGGLTNQNTASANPYDPLNIGSSLAPSMTVLVFGANHWNTAGSVSAFSSDLNTLITTYSASGPVVLVADSPSNPSVGSNASFAVQQTYVDAMRSVAVSTGCLMLDLWRYFGGTGTDFANYVMADGIHPHRAGYGMGAGLFDTTFAQV